MNTQIIECRRLYKAPSIERLDFRQPLHLLVSASVEAEIEDWEIGEEL